MATKKKTPLSDLPGWVPATALAVAGLAVYKFLVSGVDGMLALPQRVATVEIRTDKTEETLKGVGGQLERLIQVQEKLETDRIRREVEAAESQRRRLDEATTDAKRRDEDRQKFWQEQRERDRAALKESLREALQENAPAPSHGR